MNIFGLGLEEIIFILLLVLGLFAPGDIQRTGAAIGRGLNRLARSETWRLLRRTGEELRTLPGRWMREAQVDEWQVSAQKDSVVEDSPAKGKRESGLRGSEIDKREKS